MQREKDTTPTTQKTVHTLILLSTQRNRLNDDESTTTTRPMAANGEDSKRIKIILKLINTQLKSHLIQRGAKNKYNNKKKESYHQSNQCTNAVVVTGSVFRLPVSLATHGYVCWIYGDGSTQIHIYIFPLNPVTPSFWWHQLDSLIYFSLFINAAVDFFFIIFVFSISLTCSSLSLIFFQLLFILPIQLHIIHHTFFLHFILFSPITHTYFSRNSTLYSLEIYINYFCFYI